MQCRNHAFIKIKTVYQMFKSSYTILKIAIETTPSYHLNSLQRSDCRASETFEDLKTHKSPTCS